MQKQPRLQKQGKSLHGTFHQIFSYSMRAGLALACALAMIGVAFGQSTTDGAIGGTVFDNTGAVVAHAKVTAHNDGTNAEQTTETDSSGYYRIIQLQPGNYTVTVNQTGFAPFKASQVVVQIGSLTQVAVHLAVAGTVTTVEVSGEAPQINYNTPELAPVLDQTSVQNLPINGGRWSNFTMLTPTVVSDSNGFGLVSFRGISTLLNNNTVDGADNNQAFFSEERGRTRAGYSTPKVAIQEFQVNTSNYSSEYGRSAGGVTNTVTKSGTNDLHGEAYFYDRDAGWGAANEFTRVTTQDSPGVFVQHNIKPKDWRKITGFGVGGSIIKDKLFWFLSFDYYIRNFPGTAVTSRPDLFFTQKTTANVNTLATRLGITSAQAGTLWDTDTAALNTILGPVPRTGEQNIWFPKIDWQITPKHHAAFTFNRMRWASPAGIQTQSTNTFGIASFGDDFVKDTWGVAKLNSMLTSNIVNELRYQYGRDFEFEFTQKPTPYELANLVNAPTFTNPLGLPPQVSITNGFTFGVPSFLQRPAFPDETRHQIADTVSWTHGNHNLKFGVDFSRVNDNSKNLRNQFGSYSYSNLLAYFSDLNGPNLGRPTPCRTAPPASIPIPCYSSFSQAFGPLGFEFQTDDLALFAQDDWKILPRLSLSLGVRYEDQMLPSPFSNLVNPNLPLTAHMPSDQDNFGPRLGFSFDVFGDGKTVLRGGYGIYYGRIINSTILNALTQTGITAGQITYSINPNSALTRPCALPFPQILSGPPTCPGGKTIASFGRNFQNPQIHQTDLTLEHDLGWNTVFSISYLGSMGRHLPGFADINVCTSQDPTLTTGCTNPVGTITYNVVGGGPITTPTITEPLFTQRINPNFGTVTTVFSGINSSYNALVAQVNHRMSHHVQFSANYTWSHAIDFGQNQSTFSDFNDLLVPNNIRLEKANSIYNVPHRFVLHAIMTSPWKYDGWAGILANDWDFDPVLQVQNGLPYTLVTTGTPPGGLGSSINGSGGDNRIDVVGRNTFSKPMTWVPDIRVAKHFKFQERYELELISDFFNIANKQNVTGVVGTGGNNGAGYTILGNTLTFNPASGTTNNSNSNFTYSPRQIQLGVRVKF